MTIAFSCFAPRGGVGRGGGEVGNPGPESPEKASARGCSEFPVLGLSAGRFWVQGLGFVGK